VGILDSVESLRTWTDKCAKQNVGSQKIPPRKRILMVHPQHFRVAYAINPHMKTADGSLQKVDSAKALSQWKNILQILEECGLEVEVLDGDPDFPDMVFAANQSFPFWNLSKNAPDLILSHMARNEREGEVQYFEDFFQTLGYGIHSLPKKTKFEGTGDAIIDLDRKIIFCGFGFRTDSSAPARICEQTGYAVVPLQLTNENLYHLDACFALLNSKSVVVAKDAFAKETLKLIEAAFENVIYVDADEASKTFAANLFCPNSKDVIIEEQNEKTIAQLEKLNYRVHPVNTSEFIKAGGSVFCIKLFYW
jgi:N-dimethylarginine dimethylaminohydrolase